MKRLLNFALAYVAALALLLAPAHAQVAVDTAKTGTARAATLLCASAVAASVTGTTNETVLATCTIPAGAMGVNGGIEVRTLWTFTNSANAKTWRIRLGGVGGTQFMALTTTTNASSSDIRRIRNRGAANSQVGSPAGISSYYSANPNVVTIGAVDTAVSQDLALTAQLALAAETITLESYEVWVLP
jgi:hypothetical protein